MPFPRSWYCRPAVFSWAARSTSRAPGCSSATNSARWIACNGRPASRCARARSTSASAPASSTTSAATASKADRIEFGGRAVVKPTGVVLPDGTHVPGDLPIAFAHFVFRGQDDLAHQGPHILAGVHPGDGLVVDVLDGVAQSGQLGCRCGRRPRSVRSDRSPAARAADRALARPTRSRSARRGTGRRAW